LDRIHRVKFDALDENEKVTVVDTQMLPELLKRFGMTDSITIPDPVVRFIVNEYTCEAGVRKLKEILYEIVSELNLSVLGGNDVVMEMNNNNQYIVTTDVVRRMMSDRHPVREKGINLIPKTGVINGMWANAAGQGGVLPIESKYFPTTTAFDLKLTGMQGDVMKESMGVAKTLAWSLLTVDEQKALSADMKTMGVHIHCPEGAVPKDGPSAGTAITVVMYSLFTGRKIKNDLSITGEMCLQGSVTAIGGLDLKILGAIRAGVKEVIFPSENLRDFEDFMKRYGTMKGVVSMKFHMVDCISEVLDLVFV